MKTLKKHAITELTFRVIFLTAILYSGIITSGHYGKSVSGSSGNHLIPDAETEFTGESRVNHPSTNKEVTKIRKATTDPLHPRIDSHIHLYDTERKSSVAYLDPERHKEIYFPHYAQEFIDVAAPAGVGFAIVVEASRAREDNYWMMSHVDTIDALAALIGNLDPRDSWYVEDLDSLSKNRKFRGIRIRTASPLDFSDQTIIERFSELEKRNLVLELMPVNIKAEEVINIARRYPNMNIILNHLAGLRTNYDQEEIEKWKARLAIMASEPNVYCKVSSVFNLSGQSPAPVNPDFYAPLIDPVIDAFGTDRVIFGSNWTLSELVGSYEDMIRMLDEYCDRIEGLSTEKLFFKNTVRAYKLDFP